MNFIFLVFNFRWYIIQLFLVVTLKFFFLHAISYTFFFFSFLRLGKTYWLYFKLLWIREERKGGRD